MTATRDTAPFILFGTTPNLTVNASGASVLLPAEGLTNPFNEPIEVTEIEFLVQAQSSAVWIYDVMLRAGRHDLTNGFCPIPAVAPRYDAEEEVGVLAAGVVTGIGSSTVRWILPRPMILPAGSAITGAFRVNPAAPGNTGPGVNNTTSTLTVVAIARRIAPGTPKARTTCIPFVSGALYTAAQASAAGGSIGPAPNDLQLMNTFAAPLYVNQIVGAPIGSGAGFGVLALTSVVITGPGGILGTPRRTVADGIPQGFLGARSAIEVGHVLNPGESYRAVLSGFLNATGMAVAIAGYREEAL
jgi:hypothetical protein